jgi:hypothetical protein
MEAYTHTKQPPAKPLIGFQTQITQNVAIQAEPRYKLKSQQNACCNAPNTRVAKRQSLALNGQYKNPSIISNAQSKQNFATFLAGLWYTKVKLPTLNTLNT